MHNREIRSYLQNTVRSPDNYSCLTMIHSNTLYHDITWDVLLDELIALRLRLLGLARPGGSSVDTWRSAQLSWIGDSIDLRETSARRLITKYMDQMRHV